MNERRIVPHGSTSWRRLCRCVGAPIVCLPENVIPLGGATRASFQRRQSSRSFCLRVSGAVAPSASERPISPATISVCTNFRSCSVLSDRRFSSSRFARQKYRQNGAPMQQLNTRTVSPQSHGSSCSILVRRDETLLRLDHSNIGWAIERRRKWFARTPRAPDGAEPIL